MVTNVAERRIPPALALLLWCAFGTALVQLMLWRTAGNPRGFSPIFAYLLNAYDAHGNLILAAVVVLAFLLRREPAVLRIARAAGDHPWTMAAGAFVLLCAGALGVYHDHPLSMDEYVTRFQAQAFAAGHLSGLLPPPLLNDLIPPFFQNLFFTMSRPMGTVSATYWPGFALLMSPFAWLGVPWAANAAISALTLPALRRLALTLTGSREAAGWAVLLCAASPVFVVSGMSYYAMPAHLLCSVLYALLLLRPTVGRALLAGVIGSLALTLHNPLPHALFAAAFAVYLLLRREFTVLAALAAGYLPLGLLLGLGWPQFLSAMQVTRPEATAPAAAATAAVGTAAPAAISLVDKFWGYLSTALFLPTPATLEARFAGLSKVWTWGSAGLMVLAAWGWALERGRAEIKVLGAALLITFLGYFFVRFDQGHGWGYRYLHSAWFVLPLFGALALARDGGTDDHQELRSMAGWATALSLVAATGLRLVQTESFIAGQLRQVPPLTRAADPARPEVVFMDMRRGFYLQDLVQNDPFLRSPRILLVYRGPEEAQALMSARFPGYRREAAGPWGEHWVKSAP
jgi:hypothetical protein